MKKIITVKMLKEKSEMTNLRDFAESGVIPAIEKVGKRYEADGEMIAFLAAACIDPDTFLSEEANEFSVPNMKKFMRFMSDVLKEISTPAALKYLKDNYIKVIEDEKTE